MTLTTTASGFRDGLGERVFAIDRVNGEACERLRVRPELAAFEAALGLQIDRVSALTDPRFPGARDVDRDRATGQVCVVSDYAAGERLSEVLAAARARGVFPDIAAGLQTTNELLLAMAAFSRATKMAHGAIAPSRVVLSDAGDVVITDYLYAPILARLRFSPARLWKELEIAPGAGPAAFDEASDVRQIALILMAMALGRPIEKHEYPANAAALVSEVCEVAVISGGETIAASLRAWLERALTLQPRLLFGNVAHACASFGQILDGSVARSRAALVNFLEEVRTAPELAEPLMAPPVHIAPAVAAASAAVPVIIEPFAEPLIVEPPPPPIDTPRVVEEVTVVVDERSVIAPEAIVEEIEVAAAEPPPLYYAPEFDAAPAIEPEIEAPVMDAPPIEEPAPVERPGKSAALSFFEEIINAAKALAHRVERRAPVEPEPKHEPKPEPRPEPIPPEPILPEPIRFEPLYSKSIEPATPAEAPSIEPVHVLPPPFEPASPQPAPFELPPPEPALYEPASFEPVRFEPTPFEPPPVEPAPPEPVTFEPARFEPAPFEPVPFELPPVVPEPVTLAPSEEYLPAAPASQAPAEPEIVEFAHRSFEPVPFEVPPPPPPVFEPIEPLPPVEPFPPAYAAPAVYSSYDEPAVSSSEWDIEEAPPVVEAPPPAPSPVPPPPPARPIAAAPPPVAVEPEARDRKKKKRKKDRRVTGQPDMELPEIAPPGVVGLGPPPQPQGFPQPSGLAPSSAMPEIAPPGIVPLPPPLPPPIALPSAPPIVIAPRPSIAPLTAPAPIRLKGTPPDIMPRRERRGDSRQYTFSAKVETAEHAPADPYDAPAPRPRRAAGNYGAILKIAAVVVVLAAVGFAAAKVGWSTSTSTPEPGVLTVESTPAGIDVYVDGTLKGKTPLTIPVASGEHRVKLARGKATHTVPVTIEEGKEHVERVAWSKVRQAGGLSVTSQPPGAKVYVNGTLQGETPLELPNLAAGRYTVTLEGSGGSVKRVVRVTAGEQAELDVELYSGFLRVIAPVELQLVEDGRQLGSSGGDQVLLSPGRHEIVAINEPLEFREAHTVEIEAGVTKTLTIQPTGTISINAIPWAEVWMEGQKIGETPIANRAVPIGTREIVFRHPEHGEQRVVATVKHNQVTTVTADLTKQ